MFRPRVRKQTEPETVKTTGSSAQPSGAHPGKLTGLRLGVEYMRPFYNNVNGVQMRPDDIVILGAKIDF
jgi:hypothetical protein